MRLKELIRRPHGLKARFAFLILRSFILGGVVLLVLLGLLELFLGELFDLAGFEERQIMEQTSSLQAYILENGISSSDLSKIRKWEYRRPVILLELYSDGECIYSSVSNSSDFAMTTYEFSSIESINNAITISLVDKDVTAILYSDFRNQFYMIGSVLAVLVALGFAVMLFLRGNRKLIDYLCRLNSEVSILEGGNLEYEVSVEGNDEVSDLARNMNRMRESLLQQKEKEQKLYQSSRQLVTEMSHDLRTPLTGIMLYLEILRSHKYSNEAEMHEYLDKIAAKANHMKVLSDRLFEYALDDSPENHREPLLFEKVFGDAIEDFSEDLRARGFKVALHLDWKPAFISIDSENVHRIFENLVSNIAKYAEPTADVGIDTIESGQYLGFSVINTCRSNANPVDSNGIGIESIRSIMQKVHGVCTVEKTDSVFEMTILFKVH